ncbi:fatty acid desaturase-domain-containing protein, partial [Geopyxis carbonaria]
MLHNHNHNGGVLTRRGPWAVFDKLFPYVLEPLMGHTWDSYYNHHVKHHHVEANGPGDLSSTIRYQRDELTHFLHYLGRFLFLVWIELPIYFWTHRKRAMAVRAFLTELSAYAFIVLMARWQLRPTIFVLMLPLLQMRIAMMVGNWGQHALVDEVEPGSDYRSSITVIDIPSNRDCFNDGYHTSHHLNPRRHWRDHPLHMVEQKQRYADEKALVFRDTDYFQMTLRLLMKDYDTLAGKLVPMGKQRDMSRQQLADMLRRKTRRFTEEEIMRKFGKTQ